MATSFSDGGSRSTRREPLTMGKQLVNFITCGCKSSAPFFTCIAKGGSRSRNRFLCPSVPAMQYLLSVICNSNSFQSILFKLCSVYIQKVHIEDVHLLLWADLKIFFIYFLYANIFITICHGRYLVGVI